MDVRLQALKEASVSLAYLVSVDMGALASQLDARLIDGLKNGVAQKFEYTFELCWKCIKDFLKRQEGIDEATPKKIIKAFYLAGYAIEDDYLALLRAVDDRNLLSHIYDEAIFVEILSRIPEYAHLIGRVSSLLDIEKSKE
jgi:nucleotidyltransferase substrate binding protein (TIGR01987 family)